MYGRQKRHDAVVSIINDVEILGLIETGLAVRHRHKFPSTHRLVLLRLLQNVDTQAGNHKVQTDYGHCRFKYSISEHGFVQAALIPAASLLHTTMEVVDHYCLKHTHGLSMSPENLPDNRHTQAHIAFFSINRYSSYERHQREGRSHFRN